MCWQGVIDIPVNQLVGVETELLHSPGCMAVINMSGFVEFKQQVGDGLKC